MSVFLRTVSIITITANLASKTPGGAVQPLGGVTMKSLGLLFEVSRWGSFLGLYQSLGSVRLILWEELKPAATSQLPLVAE